MMEWGLYFENCHLRRAGDGWSTRARAVFSGVTVRYRCIPDDPDSRIDQQQWGGRGRSPV